MAAPGASAPDAFDTWVFVAGMGLTVTAVGIVTATVVEDFLTGGIGVADDAPSFALAAGTLASGLAMMGVGAALPKAEQPTLVPGKTTLTLGPKM
ncbi:MAG: hypothetical protein JWN04_729 [Myxococcaceae bacterium]|nr:hypothetical protein [Myxococcaceae bacterium]